MNDHPTSDARASDVEQKLAEIVAREAMVDVSKVTPDTKLEELEVQSADFVMILMDIEETFGVYISVDNEMASVETVGDFTKLIIRALDQQNKDQPA